MTVTVSDVADYLGESWDAEVAGGASQLLAAAQQMIRAEIGDATIPAEILDQATLALCSELDMRRRNPGGVVSYTGVDQPTRLGRDPMTAIRPMLSPWTVRI